MSIQAVNTSTQPSPLKQKANRTEKFLTNKNYIFPKTMASLAFPGIGQMWNQNDKKGTNQFLAGLGLFIVSTVTKFCKLPLALLGLGATLAGVGLRIYSAVDIYKTIKKDLPQTEKK